jgi:hypothetical protein
MTARVHSWFAAGVLFCSAVLAGHVNTPAESWPELRSKCLHLGLSAERVDRSIAACRAGGLTVKETEDLFCPVYLAHEEDLPSGCLFIKLEEGLAKGIAWQEVHLAAERRLQCLRKAAELLAEVRSVRGEQHLHLIQHICLALESGLPEEVLAEVLQRPARFRYGRMIHVIEAGESLQLAGLRPEQTRQVMNDCIDRDLSCSEVMRVIDFFQNGLRNHQDFNALYANLWVSPASAEIHP